MKSPPFFILPLIALASIGSDCELRASTGHPPPPSVPSDPPTEPGDADRNGGFRLVIRSGDLRTPPEQPEQPEQTAQSVQPVQSVQARPAPSAAAATGERPVETSASGGSDATIDASPAAATGPRASVDLQTARPVPLPRSGAVWLLGASLGVALRWQRRRRGSAR